MKSIDPADLKSAQELVIEARSLVTDVRNMLEAIANYRKELDDGPTRQQVERLEEVDLKICAAYGCLVIHEVPVIEVL